MVPGSFFGFFQRQADFLLTLNCGASSSSSSSWHHTVLALLLRLLRYITETNNNYGKIGESERSDELIGDAIGGDLLSA